MKKVSKQSSSKQVSKSAPKKINVRPLGDRVLVRPLESADEKSPSGIIIPDTARKEKPEQGIVVAVGEGKRNEKGDVLAMRISVGDTVMFSKYGFQEVKIDDEDYYVVSESDVLAIIK